MELKFFRPLRRIFFFYKIVSMKNKILLQKIIFLFLSFFLFFNFSCKNKYYSQSEQKLKEVLSDVYSKIDEKSKIDSAVDEYLSSLSLVQRISQLFIINLEGNERFIPVEFEYEVSKEKKDSNALIPAGYLFFSYNINSSPEKIIDFTDSIKGYCSKRNLVPPFLSIDQEGGLVNRLKDVSGPLPSAKRVSECLSVKDSYYLYSLQALQMNCLGFNLNFFPLAEISTEKNEKFLNGRSFGSENQVISYGRAAINAFSHNSIASVLKHFPGNSNVDPHTGLPEIDLSLQELEKSLAGFKNLISYNPEGVLLSHAKTLAFDKENPACFSEKWISERLLNDFGFSGIVFSDDIFMAALNKNGFPPEKASLMALKAGVDCIMISEKRFAKSAGIIYESLKQDSSLLEKINASAKKMIEFKIKYKILSLVKDDDSFYHVRSQKENEKQIRLEKFYKAKDENVSFYLKHFVKR